MARTFAHFKTEIWNEDDFRSLTWAAQHLYVVLWTSAGLSFAGVHDWRPGRIAKTAADMTAEQVIQAGLILHQRLYIVVDEETEEVLVRSFIRNDGLMEQPNVAAAMVRDYGKIASPAIRGVVVHELQRLFEEKPELKGWRDAKTGKERASSLLGNPSVNPSSNPSGWGSGNPSPNPSVGLTRTLPVTHASLPSPNSLLPSPSPSSPSGPMPRKRGTRIPEPFVVDLPMRDWAVDRGFAPGWCSQQTERFVNYWMAKAGKDAVKVDWPATWKNWLLKASDDAPRNRQSQTDELFEGAFDRAKQREHLEIVQ